MVKNLPAGYVDLSKEEILRRAEGEASGDLSLAKSGGDLPGHPGDEVGRLAAAAFHKYGTRVSAEAVVAFFDKSNTLRIENKRPRISDDEVLSRMGFGLSISLNTDEIAEVRKEVELILKARKSA